MELPVTVISLITFFYHLQNNVKSLNVLLRRSRVENMLRKLNNEVYETFILLLCMIIKKQVVFMNIDI